MLLSQLWQQAEGQIDKQVSDALLLMQEEEDYCADDVIKVSNLVSLKCSLKNSLSILKH